MGLPSFFDLLPGVLFGESATPKGECIEIEEWKTVLEKIMVELKKEPQLIEKLESFLSTTLFDDQFAFMSCLLTNSTVKKLIGEYAAKCKQQIEMGIDGQKNATKAASIRLEGNQLFVKKEYRSALKMYTRALMFAKDGDEETPLLYANRSVAYFYLKQFENALEDIERAFKFGFDKIKPTGKLLIRKGFSLLALGRDAEAKELLNANMPTNEDDPDFAQWQQLKKESANVNHKITKRDITMSQFQDVSTISAALTTEEVFRPHERFPWLNAKIDLLYDAEKGYSLVSKEEMKYGEIVALSKPYVNLDSKRDSYERCHYCMLPFFELPKYFSGDKPRLSPDYLRMVTPLPCPECSNVLYCSEACRTASWTAYHRFECSQMAILAKMDTKAHLALRMLYTIGGLEVNSPNVKLIECKTITDHGALMIDQQAYSFVYSNQLANRITFDKNLERVLTVCFLGMLIKPNNIGGKEYLKQAGKAYYYLFRHLSQGDVNETTPFTDPFTDLTVTDGTVTPSPVLLVDGMTAIMKHSCEATVATSSLLTQSFESNVKLLYATGDIPTGTVLTLAYEIEESDYLEYMLFRKSQLKLRYSFDCACTRCVREERDCLDISAGIYYPIACSLCGSLMVRASSEQDGDSSSVLDGSYRCSSTDGCNFVYSAQQMKNVYERVVKMMEVKKIAVFSTDQTYSEFQHKVYQLKTAIDSTASLLYGRWLLQGHLYSQLACGYLLLIFVPISNRYSEPIGWGFASSTHTVDRGHLTTALLYTNKVFDIFESLKPEPGIKTQLTGHLACLFGWLDMFEPIILQQLLFEMLLPIGQVRRRYEAFLKMTAYDTMVVSSLRDPK